jgi:hypothetical protein
LRRVQRRKIKIKKKEKEAEIVKPIGLSKNRDPPNRALHPIVGVKRFTGDDTVRATSPTFHSTID